MKSRSAPERLFLYYEQQNIYLYKNPTISLLT